MKMGVFSKKEYTPCGTCGMWPAPRSNLSNLHIHGQPGDISTPHMILVGDTREPDWPAHPWQPFLPGVKGAESEI